MRRGARAGRRRRRRHPHYEWTRGVRRARREDRARAGRSVRAARPISTATRPTTTRAASSEVLGGRDDPPRPAGRVDGEPHDRDALLQQRLRLQADPPRRAPPASTSSRTRSTTRSCRAASTAIPIRRGFTRVKELLRAGVNVAFGHDSIMDPWYPFGVGDPVQSCFVMVHYGHMSGHDELAADARVRHDAARPPALGLPTTGSPRVGPPTWSSSTRRRPSTPSARWPSGLRSSPGAHRGADHGPSDDRERERARVARWRSCELPATLDRAAATESGEPRRQRDSAASAGTGASAPAAVHRRSPAASVVTAAPGAAGGRSQV